MNTISIKTSTRSEFVDITSQVQNVVNSSGVKSGLCVVYVPHTTAGVTINENADPDVPSDILTHLDKIIPWQDGFRHSEGNSAAHIKASLFGSSVTVIIENGKLVLGTWQSIFFAEFDGPRSRQFHIKIIKE